MSALKIELICYSDVIFSFNACAVNRLIERSLMNDWQCCQGPTGLDKSWPLTA
ncbi:hypothetical protein BJX63DRAFT_376988 [Aspergillus granulosus]|uniref:Uncharacterized protein n=1 Tax=Aspergillus granulosus TaxID=176169 RepID=A0ABR4I487_9EURO